MADNDDKTSKTSTGSFNNDNNTGSVSIEPNTSPSITSSHVKSISTITSSGSGHHVSAAGPKEVHRFGFDGKGREMLLIMLVNIILTILTLGIYQFWGRVRTRKYLWSHFTFLDDRLEYTGSGKELFISALKIAGIFFLFGIFYTAISKFAPKYVVYGYMILNYILFFLLAGFIQYSARNYRLARTRWRSIHMGMSKARKEYMKNYVIWTLLLPLTLGIIAPWRWIKLRRILVNNTCIGNKQLEYRGEAKEIALAYILGFIATVLSLGLYYPWHKARLIRYDYRATYFGGARFKSIITGSDLFVTGLACFFMVLLTAGIATPWAIKIWIELQAETLAIVGDLPLHEISQAEHEGSATAEELANFLDVDFGF